MCGITGFLQRPAGAWLTSDLLAQMTDRLQHRGPDDRGVWLSPDHAVGLGHRRLAVQDLSALGHQPMRSASGRYVLIYNGEIYNFPKLRETLAQAGHAFRGHSDTEVMLAAFEEWGVAAALPRFAGMFAFAVWDTRLGTLTLARDRFGVKPLYYGKVGHAVGFASELAPFTLMPGFERRINRAVLPLYLRYGLVPGPHCIWEGIQKLPPGTFLALGDGPVPAPTPYWRLADVVASGKAAPYTGSFTEAVADADRLLRNAVSIRMISDVPLGVFLSGGIDSSLVTALMQAQSLQPVRSFTIGFEDAAYDESAHAAAVARHLGTNHTTLVTTEAHALGVIPRLAGIFDEPFADSSQIPTFLVSQMARRHVTVALSGDGGDEIFGGYNRHVATPGLWRKLGKIPAPVRQPLARLFDQNAWRWAATSANGLLPASRRVARPLEKLQKLAVLLKAANPADAHLRLSSFWPDPADGLLAAGGPSHAQPAWPDGLNFAEFMMYADALQYLPDDILVKVDRASMAVALEVREPLLDHRLAEFAWRLPLDFKIRQGRGKYILREVLDRYVPSALVDRPKTGFGIPLDAWLRGALRDWAEGLLAPARLQADGYFNPRTVQRLWTEHQSGRRDHQHRLWSILMFNAWLDVWK